MFPEMPCYQPFAIEACPLVNVREATRGQAIQRKPPRSGLQGHFCKNCCTRVFTSAIPPPIPGTSRFGHCRQPKTAIMLQNVPPILVKKDSGAKNRHFGKDTSRHDMQCRR